MRPVTDKFKISREKLAFIIDATAAPVAGIAIVSTWVGYEISIIKDSYGIIGSQNINAFEIFVETIPYRFYNIFMLFFVVCTAVYQREFGPMLDAQKRALSGEHDRVNYKILNIDDKALEPKENINLKISNALIPIFVLIIGAFIGFYFNGLNSLSGETLHKVQNAPFSMLAFRETFGAADASVVLFEAALFASIIAIFLGIYNKIFKIKEAIEVWVKGWQTMMITIVILLLAWSLSSIIKDLGTSKYLVTLLSNSTPSYLLPMIIFVLGSFISFSTGTSYGTMGILMPLAIPLAHAVGVSNGLEAQSLHIYMIINISSVLTGAIFGDHCSPISDTTILSSMGASCNHINHVSTQIPYAITVCLVSIVAYLLVAIHINVYLTLILGFIAIVGIVRFIGKKV